MKPAEKYLYQTKAIKNIAVTNVVEITIQENLCEIQGQMIRIHKTKNKSLM